MKDRIKCEECNMKNGSIQNLSNKEKEMIEEAALSEVAVTINGKTGTYVPNTFYAMGATHLDDLPAFKLEESDLQKRVTNYNLQRSEITADERKAVSRPAAYALASIGSSLKKVYNGLRERLTSRDVNEGIEATIKAYVEQ